MLIFKSAKVASHCAISSVLTKKSNQAVLHFLLTCNSLIISIIPCWALSMNSSVICPLYLSFNLCNWSLSLSSSFYELGSWGLAILSSIVNVSNDRTSFQIQVYVISIPNSCPYCITKSVMPLNTDGHFNLPVCDSISSCLWGNLSADNYLGFQEWSSIKSLTFLCGSEER